jgi:hypothetical protein
MLTLVTRRVNVSLTVACDDRRVTRSGRERSPKRMGVLSNREVVMNVIGKEKEDGSEQQIQ